MKLDEIAERDAVAREVDRMFGRAHSHHKRERVFRKLERATDRLRRLGAAMLAENTGDIGLTTEIEDAVARAERQLGDAEERMLSAPARDCAVLLMSYLPKWQRARATVV